jgi:hypothetical protein
MTFPTCSRKFRAFNHGDERDHADATAIVLHGTQGPTAEGAARWFATHIPIDDGGPGSTQLVIDDHSCFRTLDNTVEPFGAPPLNFHGLHIEFASLSTWTTAEWMAHRPMLELGAYRVARWCHFFTIPVRFLDAAHLRGAPADARGPKPRCITTHKQVSDAFHRSTHQDPGPGFPLGWFLRRVDALVPTIG